MQEVGILERAIAEAFDTSENVVIRLWYRYRETGDVRGQYSGHIKTKNPRQVHFIQLQALGNRTLTATPVGNELQRVHNIVVNNQTVRKRLHRNNLQAK